MNISFNKQINKKLYGCIAEKIKEHFTIIQDTSSLKNKPCDLTFLQWHP